MKKEKNYENYTLLYEHRPPKLEEFIELYKKNRFKARVLFFNGEYEGLRSYRLVKFNKEKDNFDIVLYVRKYGISKTNVLYHRETIQSQIFKKDSKYYYKTKGKKLLQLTYNHITQYDINCQKKMVGIFLNEFPPLEIIMRYDLLRSKSFNYIKKHKLTSLRKMLNYTYKAPYNISKELDKLPANDIFRRWLYFYSDYITNIENINIDYLKNNISYFTDILKMAQITNTIINLGWSAKRFEQEHNKMGEIITEIKFSQENETPLNNSKIFIDFANYSGFNLIKSNKELVLEGMYQHHCIATYENQINNGNSGIYHVNGYTLELGFYEKGVWLKQIKGKYNVNPPTEFKVEIEKYINNFNTKNGVDTSTFKTKNTQYDCFDVQ